MVNPHPGRHAGKPRRLAASAENISYSFVEAGYSQTNVDESLLRDPKLKGGYIRGSFGIAENVNLFAGYDDGSTTPHPAFYGSDFRLKLKQKQYEFGAGYHMPFTDRLDFTADLAYVHLEMQARIDGVRSKATGNGRPRSLGLRGTPSAKTEAWAKVGYLDGSDFNGDFIGTLGRPDQVQQDLGSGGRSGN